MTECDRDYTCAICGETFHSDWSEEEAQTELHEQFGEDASVEDCVKVCDDCWEKVRPDRNPEALEAWRKETS